MNDQYLRDALAIVDALSDEEIVKGLREHGIEIRRATPAAAVPEGALPPLPKGWETRTKFRPGGYCDTDDAMKNMQAEIAEWRARAAVEADRAQAPRDFETWWNTPNAKTGHPPSATLDPYSARNAWDAAVSADRAQQGEPVGYNEWAAGNLPEYHGGRAPTWETVEANVRMETRNAWIAATKAAAPADVMGDRESSNV